VHRRLARLPVPEIGADPAAADALPPAAVAAKTHPGTPADDAAPLIRVQGLAREFDLSAGWLVRTLARQPKKVLRAVDDVHFDIPRGGTFGLVGESGSGKSTVARMIAGLTKPTAGRVLFDGIDRWGGAAQTAALRRRFQMIFQDPYASLNPRWRVDRLIAEPVEVLGLAGSADETAARVAEALRRVRMSPDDGRKYPHQFSGGQRQRIAIARALASQPEFIVCDEPTSSLDVSVQAQVLNLMRDLQDEFGLTYLLISHNLAVIRHMCDHVGVMQRGRLVEQGEAGAVLDAPQHAYTRELMAAVPDPRAVRVSSS
jgi:peptide/nickel transport system ATP-binding protein